MDESLQKQIEARFHELPEDVQRAIQSSHVDEKVQELGRKYTLHLDQIGTLGSEVYMVMLGFTDPAEFSGQLATQLKLPADKAETLAQEISESLFIPIRQSMQQFAEEQATHAAILNAGGSAASATTAPVTPPKPAPVAPVAVPAATTPPPSTAPTPQQPPITAPVPQKTPELHPADMLLTQKIVTAAPKPPAPAPTAVTPPVITPSATPPSAPTPQNAPAAGTAPTPPAPKPYTADPYREPIDGK